MENKLAVYTSVLYSCVQGIVAAIDWFGDALTESNPEDTCNLLDFDIWIY